MILYTMIEEKFCPNANKNVALEVTRYADGTSSQLCMNRQNCQKETCRSNGEKRMS